MLWEVGSVLLELVISVGQKSTTEGTPYRVKESFARQWCAILALYWDFGGTLNRQLHLLGTFFESTEGDLTSEELLSLLNQALKSKHFLL